MNPRVAALIVGLALVGCKKDGKSSPVIDPEGAWQQTKGFGGKTGGDGVLEVEVEVKAGQTAFQVTGSSRTDFVGLDRLIDPDGKVALHWNDWWTSDEALTDAFFGYARTVAFNWPIREEDGPLTPGTWIVELNGTDTSGDYTNTKIDGNIWLKSDADFSSGDVPVHIVYAKGTESPDVATAIEAAVDEWVAIWGQAGLTLDPTFHSSDLDKHLSFAYETHGSEEVKAFVATLPPGELVLIVGETVDRDTDTFGLAGGIPGPLEASPFTWVLVGWLTNAGPNGVFNAEEIRIMGETMAHEVGHFSGLYHPIDFDNNFEDVVAWDALGDTPPCVEWEGCEAVLADNVMYPYPVCDYYGDGGCIAANVVSTHQGGVWHRYLGVK